MKNYEEVAQDVFRRRDEYDQIMAKRKKAVKKAIVTLSCFCVVAVGGIAVWQNGLLSNEGKKVETAPAGNSVIGNNDTESGEELRLGYNGSGDIDSDGCAPDGSGSTGSGSTGNVSGSAQGNLYGDSLEDGALEGMGSDGIEDYIIVNELEAGTDGSSKIVTEVQDQDFVEMTREELITYFGINVFPEVPLDVLEHGSRYGVYKREQGTGEIYWDCQRICYDNEDGSRSVDMEFRKGDIPLTDMIFYYSTEEKSLMNGTDVMIGRYGDSAFEVEMIYKNVGFRIHFRGLSEEEVIAVIYSLLQEA